jgi:hypothetical protein
LSFQYSKNILTFYISAIFRILKWQLILPP